MTLREDAVFIIKEAIRHVLPDEAVRKALEGKAFGQGKLYLVAAGKAAWQMTKTDGMLLGDRLEKGVVITKYDHVMGELPRISCYEAGHPVSDEFFSGNAGGSGSGYGFAGGKIPYYFCFPVEVLHFLKNR
ncbi:MAG: DUF4147 domain-containing protein [Lachnospiraceae bacterium]